MNMDFTSWHSTILTRWHASTKRERQSLTLAAVIVGLAMLFQLLWSAESARNRLHQEVPLLRAELDVMRQQAREWHRLRSMPLPPEPPQGEALETAVRASLSGLGEGSNLSIRLTAPRQLHVQGVVSFDRWIDWLAQQQASHQLIAVRISVRRGSTSGMVQVDAELTGRDDTRSP